MEKVQKRNVKSEKSEKLFISQKGITLIALVITIIILLILASVTISALSGDNGILTRAGEASKQTKIAEEKEILSISYIGVIAQMQGETVDIDKLKQELINNGKNVSVSADENGIIEVEFLDSQNVYSIDDGNITKIEKTSNTFILKYNEEINTFEFYDNETWMQWFERNSDNSQNLAISLLKSIMSKINEGDEIKASVASGLSARLYYEEEGIEIIPKTTDGIQKGITYILIVKPT